MKYVVDSELTEKARNIVLRLEMRHVKPERIICVKSHGSKARHTIARIHGIDKITQLAFDMEAGYIIEFLSEQFDKESEEEQVKTIIHELMHISHSFGGGFRHHRQHVTNRKVNENYKKYVKTTTLT